MRVAFLGTPSFAVPALQKLLEHSYEVCGVFTQPDRPSGRGQKMQPSPIKILAQKEGIPVYQPERIRDEQNRSIFDELKPDFIVVAAYGQILPGWLLRSAHIAPVNIHASLLPRYRGAAPVAWAILNGDTLTGVTTIEVDEGLDSGPILMQHEIPISMEKTAGELAVDIAVIGAELLIKTLHGLQKDELHPIAQDSSKVSWAPRIMKEMAQISWLKRALDIHNQIRGMNPWPVAHADFRDDHLRIWRSFPATPSCEPIKTPGTFLGHTQHGILVQCGDGTVLEIMEVQMPAKHVVSGREFANGAHLQPGEVIFR